MPPVWPAREAAARSASLQGLAGAREPASFRRKPKL
jgi:hypothetical protein